MRRENVKQLLQLGAAVLAGFLAGAAWARPGPTLSSANPPPRGEAGQYQLVAGEWAGRPALFLLETASGTCYVQQSPFGDPRPVGEVQWREIPADAPR